MGLKVLNTYFKKVFTSLPCTCSSMGLRVFNIYFFTFLVCSLQNPITARQEFELTEHLSMQTMVRRRGMIDM